MQKSFTGWSASPLHADPRFSATASFNILRETVGSPTIHHWPLTLLLPTHIALSHAHHKMMTKRNAQETQLLDILLLPHHPPQQCTCGSSPPTLTLPTPRCSTWLLRFLLALGGEVAGCFLSTSF
eukprot:1233655-Amphidinium_carterae.2